ncbi:MAG: MBL fold metallo-hydrolase [Gammaproteobacteria bacterium]
MINGQRSLHRALLGALLYALAATGVGAQDQDMAAVNIETVKVADGIYMLLGRGGNIGVSAGDDGVLLIDDQYAPLVPKIVAAVAGITDAPVRMVLNTHWHGDHTGGNEPLAGAGAMILAHDNVRVRMNSRYFSKFFNATVEPSPPAALPVVTFSQGVTLHLNGQTIRVEHVPPAHTDGDSIVFFEEANVVHMGDTFFNGLYPYIDEGSGGTVDGMIAAVDSVLAKVDANTAIMPGHGPLTDKQGLQKFRDMLATVAERIQAGIDAGESFDDILAQKPTAEFDAEWGQGFIKPDDWVKLVYGIMSSSD